MNESEIREFHFRAHQASLQGQGESESRHYGTIMGAKYKPTTEDWRSFFKLMWYIWVTVSILMLFGLTS